MPKIILCGLGPHAMKYHYNILESLQGYDVDVELLLDLESRREAIDDYLKDKTLKPRKKVFLPSTQENYCGKGISPIAEVEMENAIKNGATKMFISTEPKSHKIYLIWGLRHNLDIILDKPLTAPIMDGNCIDESKKIIADFEEIEEETKKSNSKTYVILPKRREPGFIFMKDFIDEFVSKWQVPLTYLNITLSEGMWNMPNEFIERENHPYKYGYGGLLHSGYHYTDIIQWFLEANQENIKFSSDRWGIYSLSTTPYDFLHQIDNEFYAKNFLQGFNEYQNLDEFKRMGELDSFTNIMAMKNDACITNISLNLIHTSFSGRAWTELPVDTYTKNGRIKHMDINIQFGTLAAINAYSRALSGEKEGRANGDLIIEIYRNAKVIGGKEYERLVFPNLPKEQADSFRGRREEIVKWLTGSASSCEFSHHIKNIEFLQKIYECRFKAINNQAPFTIMKLGGEKNE